MAAYPPGWNGGPPAAYPYMVAPSFYQEPAGAAEGDPSAMPMEEGAFEQALHGRRFGSIFSRLLPYSDGGCAEPRWFDLSLEAVYFKPSKASSRVDFSTLGPNLPAPPVHEFPEIVLSSADLKYDYQPGMRVSGVMQVGAASDIEITYLGLAHWEAAQSVTDANDRLFSPFSEFGYNPPAVPFIGFDDVDKAYFHGISLETNVNTVSIDYRRRWSGQNGLFQGSWLTGFRYFQVRERFTFNTKTHNYDDRQREGFMDYSVNTMNHMYGWQGGGDLWACLLPGWHVGASWKGGIYGNDAAQKTYLVANSIREGLSETEHNTGVAFESDVDLQMTYRINHNFTLKGGYTLMWASGLALATENFNSAAPNRFNETITTGRERVVGIVTDGNLFWHGWTFGAEYMW